ncbi:MAG: IS6 family transposase, partial [Candidatus Electrothrix sp. AX1]|nr:IS6 family transposase [Candidatus Electrothrix sp. AX1]
YIKVKGEWKYLYRAIDKEGNTLDFYLTAYRDQLAAMRFLKKLLNATHTVTPRVINTDKNTAYIPAVQAAKSSEALPEKTEHRDVKYLNNNVESDHRIPKRLIRRGLGFGSFRTAQQTISGYEAMNMVRKGQAGPDDNPSHLDQVKLVEELFNIAA